MANFEARKVLMKDAQGRYVIPFTGAVETVNGQKPDENGNVVIEGVDTTTLLTKTVAAETYLSKTDAASTYLNVDTASGTFLSKTDAASTYLTQALASAAYLGIGDKAVSAETADNAVSATMASKAISDANGNAIATTYATKAELTGGLKNCLPLSGGTISGNIRISGSGSIMETVTDSSVGMYGGNSWRSGGGVEVYGPDAGSSTGVAQLLASDGTNSTRLELRPDGRLRVADKDVVRSINGILADAAGNIQVGTGDAYEADILEAADKALAGYTAGTGQVDLTAVLSAFSALEAKVARYETELESRVHLIESGTSEDGSSWYRKYSDGWIEQGGICSGTQDSTTTVTLPCQFSTSAYHAQATVDKLSNSNVDDCVGSIAARTQTTIGIYTYDAGGQSYTRSVFWLAYGY